MPFIFPILLSEDLHQLSVGMKRCDILFSLLFFNSILGVFEIIQKELCRYFGFSNVFFINVSLLQFTMNWHLSFKIQLSALRTKKYYLDVSTIRDQNYTVVHAQLTD